MSNGEELDELLYTELRRVRADRIVETPTEVPGRVNQRFIGREMREDEKKRFRLTCDHLVTAATKTGADLLDLARRIWKAWDRTKPERAAALAMNINRLDPDGRRQYRRKAAQAGELAAWLAGELCNRQIASGVDSMGVQFRYHDPASKNREIDTLGELVFQRFASLRENPDNPEAALEDSLKRRAILPEGQTELHRAAQLVSSLRWMQSLLANDAARARPAKRPPAVWKPTAMALRTAFEELLGRPHLEDVRVLTALALKIELDEVPMAELSKGFD